MLTLSEKIRALRGDRTFARFAQVTGVSHQTLYCLERGQSVKVETLEKIAAACGVKGNEWISLLILWIQSELGEAQFSKLQIAPTRNSRKAIVYLDLGELVLSTFFKLTNSDQANVLKAMARQSVRACLPAINGVYEEGMSGRRGFVDHEFPNAIQHVSTKLAKGKVFFQPSNEVVENPRRRP